MKTYYNRIGGETAVRHVVEQFYNLMDTDPDFAGIRKLHNESLDGAREKLFMFLSGWLGGPQLYVEQYGHPRLRARHLPFQIGISERDQWMNCMLKAMSTLEIDRGLLQELTRAFSQTADFMRNKEG